MTTDYPRFANLRDTADGLPAGALRRGVLMRSDAPWAGDETPTITGWPPTVVIDLRDREEITEEHPYTHSASVHTFSLISEANVGEVLLRPRDKDPRLIAYLAMAGDRAGPLLARIVDLVANADGAALVHCAAGKDRTGVVIALILRLVGIEREAVVKEYLLTELARDRLIERLRSSYPHEYGEGVGYSVGNPLTFLLGLEAVIEAWDAMPGGVVGFYLAQGGTEASLARLRARLSI